MAPYSAQATLNPNETCEFPADMETLGGKCLIFDAYGEPTGENPTFGMLVLIEVFRLEMEFARQHGGRELLEKLKQAGHYPYSDLDREPVARGSPVL
ncbi:MAG: suppressor of fused domain protein, partial [Planctomycetes bacterium]|nr:suppressor of fused domain protein [Planctomycetota bacterium]